MLISHAFRFIYLKTRKTAGTSVELYFERYCIAPDTRFVERHAVSAVVSEWGIIGSRGSTDETWFNHMPGSRVRELLGEERWNSYFKFCVVRNPFDKVVSQFWFDLTPDSRRRLLVSDFQRVRKAFLAWTRQLRFPTDQWVYTAADAPIVDQFIRFECLHEDMSAVCRRLEVPWRPEQLGRYKSEYRARHEPFSVYYDTASLARVRTKYAWEIEYFGYSPD